MLKLRVYIYLMVAAAMVFTAGCPEGRPVDGAMDQQVNKPPVISENPPYEEEGGGDMEEPLVRLDFLNDSADELIAALSYLSSPIEGRKVTTVAGQLPNAPRRYRNGIHEGLDYYDTAGRVVAAAGAGLIIRADHDFVEMTLEEYYEVIRQSVAAPQTPPELLDKLRGMQVWISHDDGVITRYCHLSSIRPEIRPGVTVTQGEALGIVGNSGTKGNIDPDDPNPSLAPHLHFEIWYDGVFLGEGRQAEEIYKIYSGILDN